MNAKLLLLGTLSGLNAIAHDTTDWRTDRAAFDSYVPPTRPFLSSFSADALARRRQLRIDVDQNELRTKLSELSGAVDFQLQGQRSRITERGSREGRALARSYLKREYERLGFRVSEHAYSPNGVNFIAERAGADPSKVLIVSSHLDSVDNAGADDNGSGTISAWALAKALSGYRLKHTLRIVAFDQEELGLVGSRAYVRELANSGALDAVIADINVEMTGYNARKDGAVHVIDCDREDSVPFAKHVVDAIAREELPLARSSACTNRSDHASFWDKNKAAIVISQNFFGGDSNPCYHEACDKVDIIDFNYMENITRAVTSAVGAILEVETL